MRPGVGSNILLKAGERNCNVCGWWGPETQEQNDFKVNMSVVFMGWEISRDRKGGKLCGIPKSVHNFLFPG